MDASSSEFAGLFLLLVYPAGLAAQTEVSNRFGRSSPNTPARESDGAWVTTPRSVPRSPPYSLSERLVNVRTQSDAFAFSDPLNSLPDDNPKNDVAPAAYLKPAESSNITPSMKSLSEPPDAENPAKSPPSPYPALPPPGARNSAPAGKPIGGFGGIASLATAGGSLALVLGLFMIMAWVMRRTVPGTVPALPGEVVEVLGRAPLAGRQQVHLIRCGGKLILVSVTPEGAETLTEITEPEEVDRLAGLCRETHPGSASSAFRHVFGQLSRQRTDSAILVDSGELNLSGMGIVHTDPRVTGRH